MPTISSMHEEKPPIAFKQETVVIDAGHGGKDSGAVSKLQKYEEKKLTLSTAFMIRNYLRQLGYQAILTRGQDTFVPLSTRADIANTTNVDLFVSIHYNYSPNKEAQGVEVYYYKGQNNSTSDRIALSKRLGQAVLKKIVRQTKASSRGVKQGNFAVIRETKMPAILIEAGFLSNPEEREKLRDPQYLQKIAKGIAKGIDSYFESNHE